VLDVSAALSWIFADERDELALAMANAVRHSGAVVPPLFRHEMENGILVAVRRGRLGVDQARKQLEHIAMLQLTLDAEASGFEFAHALGISVYDAAYLDVAARRRLPLLTRDRRLSETAASMKLLWTTPS
jgi:predicted nucleic acid-binding protein